MITAAPRRPVDSTPRRSEPMGMYAVVGCRDCGALWVVEGRPETTGCPRCQKRHQFRRLKRFAEAEDAETAREARATLLAQRAGHDLDSFGEQGAHAGEPVVTDEEYLGGFGLDPEVVAAAETQTGQGPANKRETILRGLRELGSPTEEAIVEYAAERGVPASYTQEALERLARAGEVTESGGRYRLV